MSLPTHQLEAFFVISELRSFSKAATRLHLTQPALSQRVRELESTLGSRVFVRHSQGVRLTAVGHRLLRFCHAERALRAELVADLELAPAGHDTRALAGSIRVAAFSSVARSCVLPAVAPLLRQHPGLSVELFVREMGEIEEMLVHGNAEFGLLDHVLERPELDTLVVGQEELVLVENRSHRERDDRYLDHDEDDETTMRFLRRSGGSRRRLKRAFLDDIYGILDGVELGLGRAVVSRHLLATRAWPNVRIAALSKKPRRPALSPVVLHWHREPVHPRAHAALLSAIRSGVADHLAARELSES